MVNDASVVRTGRSAFCRDVYILLHVVLAAGFVTLRLAFYHEFERNDGLGPVAGSFYRGALRVYDFIGLGLPGAPGWGPALGFLGSIAMQVTFVVSGLCLTVLLVVLLRTFAPERISRAFLHPWIAFIGLLAWLVSWFYFNIVRESCSWGGSAQVLFWDVHRSYYVLLLLMGAPLIIVTALRMKRIGCFPLFGYGAYSSVHFAFWLIPWCPPPLEMPAIVALMIGFVGASMLAICMGLLCLHRVQSHVSNDLAHQSWRAGRHFPLVIASLLSLSLLLLIWLPSLPYKISHSANAGSLKIEIQRTACFGVCPDYSVEIDGRGKVTYIGRRFVAAIGRRTSAVPQDQIQRWIDSLDHLGFFGLDDRLFGGCSDTPKIVMTVSLDDMRRTVAIDSTCGPEKGVQQELVKLATEIDRVIGTDQWVQCADGSNARLDGRCLP